MLKNILYCLILCFIIQSSYLNAQQDSSKIREKEAIKRLVDSQLDILCARLLLTDKQIEIFTKLLTEYSENWRKTILAKIRKEFPNDEDQLKEGKKYLHELDKKLEAYLTEEQKEKFTKYTSERDSIKLRIIRGKRREL